VTKHEIIRMQERVGTRADGFWGPKSIAACQRHLRGMMPETCNWPSANNAALYGFYGPPGDESQLVMIDFPYPMLYDGRPVTRTRVHRRCADSLLRVLRDIAGLLPSAPHLRDAAQDYGGIYNFRKKRGGTSYSLHAYGAAIDLDADDNTFRDPWPLKADMPLEIIEAFAREGWVSAAAFWGYDAMHFQATRI